MNIHTWLRDLEANICAYFRGWDVYTSPVSHLKMLLSPLLIAEASVVFDSAEVTDF